MISPMMQRNGKKALLTPHILNGNISFSGSQIPERNEPRNYSSETGNGGWGRDYLDQEKQVRVDSDQEKPVQIGRDQEKPVRLDYIGKMIDDYFDNYKLKDDAWTPLLGESSDNSNDAFLLRHSKKLEHSYVNERCLILEPSDFVEDREKYNNVLGKLHHLWKFNEDLHTLERNLLRELKLQYDQLSEDFKTQKPSSVARRAWQNQFELTAVSR